MFETNNSKRLDLVYQERDKDDESRSPMEHAEAGASSLIGRRGDNMTFHPQQCCPDGYFSRIWSWAWKDLGKTFVGLLGIFSLRDK